MFYPVGEFSTETLGSSHPHGWEAQTFRSIPQHTEYTCVEDDGSVVIQARSEAASSGLTRKVQVDLKTYPILQWRWKVQMPVTQSDLTSKEGDACSARLFITFGRILTSLKALSYVWTAGHDQGSWLTSPVSNRVKMVVLRNQTDPLDVWINEERNVAADFEAAFGEAPPKSSGVALMTDTCRTGETAVAFYGDILFKQG